MRKHLPDVEDRGQRAQQFVARLDVPHAVSLERERVLQRLVVLRVLNGERNLIRDERQKRDVLCVVRVALPAACNSMPRRRRGDVRGSAHADWIPWLSQVGDGLREPGLCVLEGKHERLLMLDHPVGD